MRHFLLAAAGLAALASTARAGDHWAYLPPLDVKISADAAAHPIDAILATAGKSGIQPAPLAPPRQWVERAAYTLTGLPPTEEQLRASRPIRTRRRGNQLVDELLASPAYGERWARHWMDVARYADTRGYNFDQDNRYPFAYTYRDWLINAAQRGHPLRRNSSSSRSPRIA